MQKHVKVTSIDQMARSAAKSLRCQVQIEERNPRLMIKNVLQDSYVMITVSQKSRRSRVLSLLIESGSIRYLTKKVVINHNAVDHIYVCWDSPKMISFCFLEGNRFILINITADAEIHIVSNIDRRRDEPEDLSDDVKNQRQTFFHIGKLYL